MSTGPARYRRRTAARRGHPLIGLAAGTGLAFLVLPLLALLVRAPWGRAAELVRSAAVLDALRLSLVSAAAATVLCLVLGVPLAWLLARARPPVAAVLRGIVTVPLVLPPVVGGVALLLLLGRRGLLGRHLDALAGISLPFTTSAVVLAEAFVAMPFLVLAVEGSLRGVDGRLETAAATLGAGGLTVFLRVTLPLAAPGVVAGAALCFARALGEFGATITFAGSFPGVTQTVPLAVYLALESDPDAAVALSVVLLAVSVLVLAGLRERWVTAGRR